MADQTKQVEPQEISFYDLARLGFLSETPDWNTVRRSKKILEEYEPGDELSDDISNAIVQIQEFEDRLKEYVPLLYRALIVAHEVRRIYIKEVSLWRCLVAVSTALRLRHLDFKGRLAVIKNMKGSSGPLSGLPEGDEQIEQLLQNLAEIQKWDIERHVGRGDTDRHYEEFWKWWEERLAKKKEDFDHLLSMHELVVLASGEHQVELVLEGLLHRTVRGCERIRYAFNDLPDGDKVARQWNNVNVPLWAARWGRAQDLSEEYVDSVFERQSDWIDDQRERRIKQMREPGLIIVTEGFEQIPTVSLMNSVHSCRTILTTRWGIRAMLQTLYRPELNNDFGDAQKYPPMSEDLEDYVRGNLEKWAAAEQVSKKSHIIVFVGNALRSLLRIRAARRIMEDVVPRAAVVLAAASDGTIGRDNESFPVIDMGATVNETVENALRALDGFQGPGWEGVIKPD